jgi:hypothetical protein
LLIPHGRRGLFRLVARYHDEPSGGGCHEKASICLGYRHRLGCRHRHAGGSGQCVPRRQLFRLRPFGDFYDSYSAVPVYGSYWGGPYLNYAPGEHDDYDSGYVAAPNAVHARRHCRIEAVRTRSGDHRFMRQVRVCD